MAIATAKKRTADDEIAEKKIEAERKNAVSRAFALIGEIPEGFFKATATKVGVNAHRVNIYVRKEGNGVVPAFEIAHSLFLRD